MRIVVEKRYMLLRLAVMIYLALASGIVCGQSKKTPTVALNDRGHTERVWDMVFTPDGRKLISVSGDKTIRIWEVDSGSTLRVLRPPVGPANEGALYAAAITRDGRWLAVGGHGRRKIEHPIYLISLQTYEIERVLKGHSEKPVFDLAFSADGSKLMSASDTAVIWDVETGRKERELAGHAKDVYGVAFSPEGDQCATASLDGTAAIWSVASGRRTATLRGHAEEVTCIDWSADGRHIATGSLDRTIRLWSSDGQPVRTFASFGGPGDRQSREIGALRFASDSSHILYTSRLPGAALQVAGLIDIRTGNERVTFSEHNNAISHGAISPDGRLAATTGGDREEIWLWRTDDGTPQQMLAGEARAVWSVGWSHDGSQIAWGNTNEAKGPNAHDPLERVFDLKQLLLGGAPGTTFRRARVRQGGVSLVYDGRRDTEVNVIKNGRTVATLRSRTEYQREYNRVRSFSLLDADRAVVGTNFGASLFDTSSGEQLREFRGHTGEVWSVGSSPDGRYLATAGGDMTLRIWKPDEERPLLSLFFAGPDWIAWTPDGYYACSAAGEQLMGWRLDNGPNKLSTFLPAVQFREKFFRPDSIARLLETGGIEAALRATTQESRRTVAASLPPRVDVISPTRVESASNTERITVVAVGRQAGTHPIRWIRLLVDGSPSHPGATRRYNEPRDEVKETWQVELAPGLRRIRVEASNGISRSISEIYDVTVISRAPSKPSLYILAIGISDYQNDKLDLKYADADAATVTKTLEASGQDLFEKIEIRQLLNEKATADNIVDELLRFQEKLTRHHIGIVFYAGHAQKARDNTFVLMPTNVDPGRLLRSGVDESFLKDRLNKCRGTRLVFLDCCHAAGVRHDPNERFRGLTDIAGDLVRTIPDEGVIIMCSSRGSEEAIESDRFKHGLFTQALIEGLSGKRTSDGIRSDVNEDGTIGLSELSIYVSERVQELSNGRQTPVYINDGVSDFSLSHIKKPRHAQNESR